MSVNSKLTAIADAIRGKTGGTEDLTLDTMATEIAGIEAGGGGNPLDYAVSISRMFHAMTTSPRADVEISFGNKVTGALYADAFTAVLYNTNSIRSIKISCGAPVSSVSMANFADTKYPLNELEKVDLTGAVAVIRPTKMTRAFYYRTTLREILGALDVSRCTDFSNAFIRCDVLETVQFQPGTINKSISVADSSKLTDESIQSVLDGLADLTGVTAQTLTLHAAVGAKLTDAQKAAASAKNWTLSY